MGKPVLIRNFRASDKPGVFRLLSGFYPNIKEEKDWSHLYMENPEGEALISLVENEEDNRIFGHYSAIKMQFNVFGESIPAAKGEGEIFDLGYIKNIMSKGIRYDKDISTKLVKHALDRTEEKNFYFVCTNPSDLALKSHIEAGYDVLEHDFSIYVRIFSKKYLRHLLAEKGMAKIATGLLSPVIFVLLRASYLLSSVFRARKSVELEAITQFDERTDHLAQAFYKECSVAAIEAGHKHLNWRFGKDEYKKFIVKINSETVGYAVIHAFANPNGFKEANLADFLLLSAFTGNFGNVISEISDKFQKEGYDLVRVNYLHDIKDTFGFNRQLEKLRFLKRPDKRNIMFYFGRLSENIPKAKLLDAKNWFFTDLFFEGY